MVKSFKGFLPTLFEQLTWNVIRGDVIEEAWDFLFPSEKLISTATAEEDDEEAAVADAVVPWLEI